MDILNDILTTLDLKGVLYFRTDFNGPWAVTVPDFEHAARFHLVMQGRCRVELADGTAVDLGPGDLAMIPRGRSHVLADSAGREAPPLESLLEAVGYDGRGVLAVGGGDPAAATQMVCGHYSFRSQADHPVLRALPGLIHIPAGLRAREPWLDEMLRLMARNIFSNSVGSTASVTRLAEIVFIEVLRAGIGQDPDLKTVIDAFRDRHIGKSIELMHSFPERPWTVESLASEVGLSRSVFAERFRDLMGIAPVAYLSDWRLQKALALLDDPRCSIQQVAARTGYRSPAAFSRAFAGRFGQPPKAYRHSPA